MIPDAFWTSVGGPWYWSAAVGVHDAATHESCPHVDVGQAIVDEDLDAIDTVCHIIEESHAHAAAQ